MRQTPLQWHPAFCSSLQIELEGEPLDFRNEYNLTRKPLQMDILVIKQQPTRTIRKSIGKLFRTHNIVEFKSPEDSLSINDFYKVVGYASIYQANTEKVVEIRPDEITMSFVVNHYPREMVKWLNRLYQSSVERKYPGIYYLTGLPFPTQIIVIKELSKSENRWLSRLRPGLNAGEDLNILAEEYKEKQSNPLYAACMDIILRANRSTYLTGSGKEEAIMCQALTELVYELYGDKIEAACEKTRVETYEKTKKETRFTTVIEMVQRKLKKHKTAEQIAEELDWEGNFIAQICQVIGILSLEASGDEVLMKWKEMFAA